MEMSLHEPRDGWAALVDLVLPAACAGCGTSGSRWCPLCRATVREAAFPPDARAVRPRPCPPGLPPVWAYGPYRGELRRAVVAYKDRDRRDLVAVLAPLLAVPLGAAVEAARHPQTRRDAGPAFRAVLVLPVPSRPAAVRDRGDRPLEALGRRAMRLTGAPALRWASMLAVNPSVRDQAGLGGQDRAANVTGAMSVRRREVPALAGAAVVIVDDVVTTGSTLAEAARVVRAAGAATVVAATVAATQRRWR